jgi:hypothetical protein
MAADMDLLEAELLTRPARHHHPDLLCAACQGTRARRGRQEDACHRFAIATAATILGAALIITQMVTHFVISEKAQLQSLSNRCTLRNAPALS